MASYKIEWKQSARKELKKLQKKTISRILQTIETLPDNPYPGKIRDRAPIKENRRPEAGDRKDRKQETGDGRQKK